MKYQHLISTYQHCDTLLMCCSGKMLGPFGGNGGVEFDSGDFRAAGCHLGHISGKVGVINSNIITLIVK